MTKLHLQLLITISILSSCEEERQFPLVKKLETLSNTVFLPTLEHQLDETQNCIYSPTILFA